MLALIEFNAHLFDNYRYSSLARLSVSVLLFLYGAAHLWTLRAFVGASSTPMRAPRHTISRFFKVSVAALAIFIFRLCFLLLAMTYLVLALNRSLGGTLLLPPNPSVSRVLLFVIDGVVRPLGWLAGQIGLSAGQIALPAGHLVQARPPYGTVLNICMYVISSALVIGLLKDWYLVLRHGQLSHLEGKLGTDIMWHYEPPRR
jgi:hypothetical protein